MKNLAQIPTMKAFDVWIDTHEGIEQSIGFFEDQSVASEYLQAYCNGKDPDKMPKRFGIKPITIYLSK